MSNEIEQFFWINNDPSLTPIKIDVIKIIKWTYKMYNTPLYIPPIEKMYNYGLPQKEQYFRYEEKPHKLKHLEQKIWDDLNSDKNEKATSQTFLVRIREYLKGHRKEYKNEIKWIKKVWYHRLFGYWFLNNGQPTYICGWHYSYLNTFILGEVGKPKYRDRDRRTMLIEMYAYTCQETFEKLDENGNAIPEPDGTYKMIDIGRRVFIGTIDTKPRREGGTSRDFSIGYDIITLLIGADVIGGCLSYTGQANESKFRTVLISAFQSKPFFFKPLWQGTDAPQADLVFNRPSYIPVNIPVLQGRIEPASTTDRMFYNSKKCYWILCDEEGATVDTNIVQGWGVLIPTLTQGQRSNIHGFSQHPTSVEDMSNTGGAIFYELCKLSNFYVRNRLTGQTLSGLLLYFIRAADGLQEFIDKYGMSVIDTPTEEQAKYIGKSYGAAEHIKTTLQAFLDDGSIRALAEYRKEKRRFPEEFADCFLGDSGEVGFNIIKIDERLKALKTEELTTQKEILVAGNFDWYNNIPNSMVVFKPLKMGRWYLSKILNEGESNLKITRKVWDGMSGQMIHAYAPEEVRRVMGADTYQFSPESESRLKKRTSQLSDGGGAVFLLRDFITDPDNKPVEQWTTYHFEATYQYRMPDVEEYCKDMLLAAIYFNAMVYPENNKRDVIQYFIKKGYAGYLLYDIDPESGTRKTLPGYNVGGTVKDELFKLGQLYIEHHAHRERHIDFLEDCKNIKGLYQMTDYDRLSACLGALRGAAHPMFQSRRRMTQNKLSMENVVNMGFGK
jgi:hypothetical protein